MKSGVLSGDPFEAVSALANLAMQSVATGETTPTTLRPV